jgi:hypothetical protein
MRWSGVAPLWATTYYKPSLDSELEAKLSYYDTKTSYVKLVLFASIPDSDSMIQQQVRWVRGWLAAFTATLSRALFTISGVEQRWYNYSISILDLLLDCRSNPFAARVDSSLLPLLKKKNKPSRP